MAPCCGPTPDLDSDAGRPRFERLVKEGRTKRAAAGVRGPSGGLFVRSPRLKIPRFSVEAGDFAWLVRPRLESGFVQFHDVVVQRFDPLARAVQQRQEVLGEERPDRDLALVEGPLGATGARVERLHG